MALSQGRMRAPACPSRMRRLSSVRTATGRRAILPTRAMGLQSKNFMRGQDFLDDGAGDRFLAHAEITEGHGLAEMLGVRVAADDDDREHGIVHFDGADEI